MKGVWGHINQIEKKNNQIEKKNKIYYDWIDTALCQIYKCDSEGEPITDKKGFLPRKSRIGKLEDKVEKLEGLVADHVSYFQQDGETVDTLKEQFDEHKKEMEDLKMLWRRQVEERDNERDLRHTLRREVRALYAGPDRPPLDDNEEFSNVPFGGGKRRKRTRKKKRKKKTKKRRKKRNRKKRTKRRK